MYGISLRSELAASSVSERMAKRCHRTCCVNRNGTQNALYCKMWPG